MQNKNREVDDGAAGSEKLDAETRAYNVGYQVIPGIPDSRVINLVGRQFGLLKIISYAGKIKNKGVAWLCKCRCESITIKKSGDLLRGSCKSCGKAGCKIGTSHGLSKKSKAYKRWRCMIERCTDKNHQNYHRYGGSGITITSRWSKFENFLKDMGEPPLGTVLDRVDNKLGYSPENCRWVSFKESTANRKNTVFIGGIRVSDLAKMVGIKEYIVYQRINRGWTREDIEACGKQDARSYKKNRNVKNK